MGSRRWGQGGGVKEADERVLNAVDVKRCGTHYDIGVGVALLTIQAGVWHSP